MTTRAVRHPGELRWETRLLATVTAVLLAFGIAFLFPVFLFAASAAGVLSSEQLARGRRWAILIIVIGAALITPSGDAFTLLVLSIPLYLLYEATYWLARLVLKR